MASQETVRRIHNTSQLACKLHHTRLDGNHLGTMSCFKLEFFIGEQKDESRYFQGLLITSKCVMASSDLSRPPFLCINKDQTRKPNHLTPYQ